MNDADSSIAGGTLDSLAMIGAPAALLADMTIARLVGLAHDSDPARRCVAFVLLARQKRLEVAADAFPRPRGCRRSRARATAAALFVRGRATLDHARLALRDGDEDATREILWLVMRNKGPRELAPEIAALVSDTRAHCGAIDALLHDRRTPEAIEGLVRRLGCESEAQVRAAIVCSRGIPRGA